jgi:protein gp37
MDVFDPDVDPAWRNDLFNIIAECTGVFWLLLTKRPQFAEMFFKRLPDLPWPNVALGVTAENQEKWNQRVEILSSIPVKARFVSVEPMLSPIEPVSYGIDWVILGGESGPKARATDTEWIRGFRNHIRCFTDQMAFMVKQLGANPTCSAITRGDYQFIENMRDSHGGNPNEWPKDLRIQQVIRQDHDDNILRRDLV